MRGSVDPHTFMSVWWDDPPSDDDIEQKGGPSMRFLYQVENILCQPGVAHCGKLYPDYQNRWNQAVPKLRQYLSQQKILGFFAGDELICHGSGVENLTQVLIVTHLSP